MKTEAACTFEILATSPTTNTMQQPKNMININN
jgi:hypothetical protein